MTIDTTDASCITAANQGRAAKGVPLVVPDESLMEAALAYSGEVVAQNTITPNPLNQSLGSYITATSDVVGPAGFDVLTSSTCASYTGTTSFTQGTPPYSTATNQFDVYYGVHAIATTVNGSPGLGIGQIYANDYRI